MATPGPSPFSSAIEFEAQATAIRRNPTLLSPPPRPPMEFRFRAGDCRPRGSSPHSTSARSSDPRGGGGGAQGMRDGFLCRGSPPPGQWEAVAWRERIVRLEVERRLIEQEVRRELALAGGLHAFMPPPPPPPPAPMFGPHPHAPPPMPMHPDPHVPPPRSFEEFGCTWQGFGRFGSPQHVGFGQRMLRIADAKRWSPSPPKPKHKLELHEIEPCTQKHCPPNCSEKVLSCEPKVSGMKRKPDASAAPTEPRKVQKPAQDWSCSLCHVSATCEAGLNEHLEGKKHKAKLAQSGVNKVFNNDKSSLQATTKNKNATASSDAPKKICINIDGAMHEIVRRKNYLWCERCRVRCDSNITMASHLRGKKHSELNKVWTSIMAVRMNAKTMDGVASACKSEVDGDNSIEIPVEIKTEDTNMSI